MGLPWGRIGRVLKGLAPFSTFIRGSAGTILRAVSTAVQIVEDVFPGKGATKRERAIDLTGTILTIVEGTTERDLLDDETLKEAVGAVIDAEVALRNAHAALSAVVEDLRRA
jgi:hypothetical protein